MKKKTIKIRCTGTDLISYTKLKRFQGELKKLPDANLQKLKTSILKNGFRIPIMVWGSKLMDGHSRLTALESFKADGYSIPEIPIIKLEADNEQDAKKLLLLINSRYGIIREQGFFEFSENFDLPELNGIINLPEIKLPSLTDEPEDAEINIDMARELNKKWKIKHGDFIQIGKHRILCGDNTIKNDMEKLMKKEKATLVFVDPPYGVSIGKKNVMLNSFQKAGRNLSDLKMDDMLPTELGAMLEKSFSLIQDYMADDCSVFVCSPQGGGLGMMMMMMMMQKVGLEVKHIINWIKNSPTFSMGRLDYDYQHEPILFTWKKNHKRKKDGQWHTSLWTVNKPRSNKMHPTMKPVELPINAILNHTDSGDIVIDNFIGSGTTMIACENTGRICRGMDCEPNYVACTLERMSKTFHNLVIKKINRSNSEPVPK